MPLPHSHDFLGHAHAESERRTWTVIILCGAMMVAEIAGGLVFGSIALVADGLHMSTHAGALLLAALAYAFARRHARDERFSFGTGKVGDLAGFSSALILAMIALLIGYEALTRLFAPVPIHYGEAILVAVIGLAVNVASAWLLSGGAHHHHHHGHDHAPDHGEDEVRLIETRRGLVRLEIAEPDGAPPHFRLQAMEVAALDASPLWVETLRPDGARQRFLFADRGGYLESVDAIPEPHSFAATLQVGEERHEVAFQEHEHGAHDHDNNLRAAIVHVTADAAVSLLVIFGLVLARSFGWVWMDPVAGLIGAGVIASWSYGLIRDTGAILLDMTPDRRLADTIKSAVEAEGDALVDLHLWRLGPGHLGAIVAVRTEADRGAAFYHQRLARFPVLSHVTVEIDRLAA